jgi:hypothetical protein
MEFSLCDCVFTPDPDPMALPARTEDVRSLSIDNCFDPDLDREPLSSGSPESLNGQMLRNVGVGGRIGVRMSMSGIHYCRAAWEKAQPTHRFSWMKPERDEWFGRDPSSFLSSSSSPSSVPPLHRHELAYLLHSRPSPSPSLLAISSPLPLPPVLDLTNDAPVTVDV